MHGGPQPRGGHADESGADWQAELRRCVRPGYLVLGVGNRLRGDDAAGSLIAERLAEKGCTGAFDCGEAPENFVGRLRSFLPCDICLIDTVDFGARPGTVRLFEGERFGMQAVSTHAAGLGPLMDFLAAEGEVNWCVLAIQPARTQYGQELSEPVRRAVEQIAASPVWFE